ncbi:MAG: hypothetical protein JW900_03170 [Anaerolineae bacterium]|nr:hypothetical protein [Anaerolineae bacterium]
MSDKETTALDPALRHSTPWLRFQGWGLASYGELVRRTARYRIEGEQHLADCGRPLIIAAWHGMQMLFAGYFVTYQDPGRYVLIVPDEPRGVTLDVWAKKMGALPFFISMGEESMVAARRLLALINLLKRQGRRLLIAPDGPDGPSHEPKAGIVFVARKAGALIVPMGTYTATGYRRRRWDQYVVPFPFSRIAVVFGEPFGIPPDVETGRAQEIVRERLNEVEQRAAALYRRQG